MRRVHPPPKNSKIKHSPVFTDPQAVKNLNLAIGRSGGSEMNHRGCRTGGIDDDSKLIDDDSQMNHLSLQKTIDSWPWIVSETGECAFRCTPNHFCVNAVMTPSATARSAPDYLGNDNQSTSHLGMALHAPRREATRVHTVTKYFILSAKKGKNFITLASGLWPDTARRTSLGELYHVTQ